MPNRHFPQAGPPWSVCALVVGALRMPPVVCETATQSLLSRCFALVLACVTDGMFLVMRRQRDAEPVAERRAPVPLPRRGGGCRVRLSGNALLLAEIAPVGRWRSRILFGYLARMGRLVISMFLAFRYYDWYGDGTASTLRGCRSTRLRTRWMPSLVRR